MAKYVTSQMVKMNDNVRRIKKSSAFNFNKSYTVHYKHLLLRPNLSEIKTLAL